MLRKIFILINAIALALSITAQDYPYPVSPGNTNVISTDAPMLTWKTSDNFTSYKVEIYSCSYDEGSSFDFLELENFIYEYFESGPQGYEASALTNNVKRPGNFTTVDDAGDKFIAYRNNFNNNTEKPNVLSGEDYEGLTYLYDGQFAVVEERDDVLTFLKFTYDSQGGVTSIGEINSIPMNNPFITGQNNGWEGLTYNPRNDKLYLAKEYGPTLLCETNLPSGPNFTGPVNLTYPFDVNSVNWTPSDISGLFHLSLDLKASATPAGDHILILSEADDIMLEVDMDGNLISYKEFDISGNFGSITNGNFKPEGIAYQYGTIWIASDTDPNNNARFYKFTDPYYTAPQVNNPGLIHDQQNITGGQYQIPAGILSNNSEYCWRVIGVTPLGIGIESEYYSLTTNIQSGCTDVSACNYNASAGVDDSSCLYITDCLNVCGGSTVTGTSCNDGNSSTVNDKYNSNCVCIGDILGCTNASACNYDVNATIDDGSCSSITDCKNICGGSALPGTTCDDGNSSTLNDKYNSNCVCVGDEYGCTDANACNYDVNATIDDGSCSNITDCKNICGGSALPGTPCNDGNSSTSNDEYNSNCDCVGIPITVMGCTNSIACNYNPNATLNDGSCTFRDCLGNCGGSALPGSSCDDGDPSTINDAFNNICVCEGTETIITVCYNITNGNDDVEETASNGNMNFGSNDVDLADTNSKIVGLRFNNIDVPFEAIIESADIQFMADESFSQTTHLNINIENTGNATFISGSNYNISNRNYTTQTVQWNNVLPWFQGQKGNAQLSPDLGQLVQQIVDRTDWQANNSMLFKINGKKWKSNHLQI